MEFLNSKTTKILMNKSAIMKAIPEIMQDHTTTKMEVVHVWPRSDLMEEDFIYTERNK